MLFIYLFIYLQTTYDSAPGIGGNHYGSVSYSGNVTPPSTMVDIGVFSTSFSLPLHEFQSDVTYTNEEMTSEHFASGYDSTQSSLAGYQGSTEQSQPPVYTDAAYNFEGNFTPLQQREGSKPTAYGVYDHHSNLTHEKFAGSTSVPPYDETYQSLAGNDAEFYQSRFLDSQKTFMKQAYGDNQDFFSQGHVGFTDLDHKQTLYHPGYDAANQYGAETPAYHAFPTPFYGSQSVSCANTNFTFSNRPVPTSYRGDITIPMSGQHLQRRTSLTIPTPPTNDRYA